MPSLEDLSPDLLRVLSEAVIIRLSLPDPPPPLREFATLATIYQLASTLPHQIGRSVQSAVGEALVGNIRHTGG